MFSMNSWSCLWASIGILITGELSDLVNFLQVYPWVMPKILLLGLTGAVGQVSAMAGEKQGTILFSVHIEFYLPHD